MSTTPLLKILTWKQARKDILNVNKDLVNIVDQINPPSSFKLIKVSYQYGDYVVRNGRFTLFDELDWSSFSEKEATTIKKSLSYSPIPFGIHLNKSTEVFFNKHHFNIPCYILDKGMTIGLHDTLWQMNNHIHHPFWSQTAGVCSAFLLSKINNANSHARLIKEMGLSVQKPRNHGDHWSVFRELAHNHPDQANWQCDIIFFTGDWFAENTAHQERFLKLRLYLYETFFHCHRLSTFNYFKVLWNNISTLLNGRRYKLRTYMVDIMKHTINIMHGETCGFAPSLSDQRLPTRFLQTVYQDIYDIDFKPTIIEPVGFIKTNKSLPVYYSLGSNRLLDGDYVVDDKNTVSKIRELNQLFDMIIFEMKSDPKVLKELTCFSNLLFECKLNFYHKTVPAGDKLGSISALLDKDPRFNQTLINSNKPFCHNSAFFNGLIQIT